MNRVLNWIKSNPVTVASAVLAVVALLALIMVGSRGGSFVERMASRDKVIRSILSYQRTLVTIPPALPDDPERELNIVVNQAAIDQLNDVYTKMGAEYTEIFRLAVELNRHNHFPMDDGLFPEPSTTDAYKRFEAGGIYRQLLREMLQPHASTVSEPRLNAGTAPDMESLGPVLDKVEKDFLATQVFPANKLKSELTDDEYAELEQTKTRKLVAVLQERAQGIGVYVGSLDIDSSEFPFDIGEWSDAKNKPEMAEIWDGQVGLWIQQDLVEAIARTNRVDDAAFNVMNAPVKRLVKIEVIPGYIGIDTRGVLAEGTAAGAPPSSIPEGANAEVIPYDFSISPTGRFSNSMYDVWHARLTMIVDAGELPSFFENLYKVNFMTVLNLKAVNIDEYAALRSGYVYGSGDAVEVELLIETIWLRDWTLQYMPQEVRERLGVEDKPADAG